MSPRVSIRSAPRWLAFTPALFVFLWSTGFIGARLSAPDAEPLSFLTWRFGIVAVILAFAALEQQAAGDLGIFLGELRRLAADEGQLAFVVREQLVAHASTRGGKVVRAKLWSGSTVSRRRRPSIWTW